MPFSGPVQSHYRTWSAYYYLSPRSNAVLSFPNRSTTFNHGKDSFFPLIIYLLLRQQIPVSEFFFSISQPSVPSIIYLAQRFKFPRLHMLHHTVFRSSNPNPMGTLALTPLLTQQYFICDLREVVAFVQEHKLHKNTELLVLYLTEEHKGSMFPSKANFEPRRCIRKRPIDSTQFPLFHLIFKLMQ